jgi:Flp pilus assembly protein TadD
MARRAAGDACGEVEFAAKLGWRLRQSMTMSIEAEEGPPSHPPDRVAAERHFHARNQRLAAGRRREALAEFRAALDRWPALGEAELNAGVVLEQEGELEDARASYARAVEKLPENADAAFALGNACFKLRRLDEAVQAYRAALTARPEFAQAWLNLGNTLRLANALAEAVECYQRVAALRPESPDAHINLANAYRAQNRMAAARRASERALTLAPLSPEAHLNYAMALLVAGDLRAAWPHAEYRHAFQLAGAGRVMTVPKWTGASDQPLRDCRILLHAEQGLGDTLHFLRYAPLVAALGAVVHVEVQAPLRELVAASLPEAASVIATGAALPEIDRHCPLPSLPLAFGTELATIPNQVPYIRVPEERSGRARKILGKTGGAGRRIGLAWAGNPTHPNDYNRSIALAEFREVAAPLAGAHFFSLKLEMTPADAALLARQPEIVNLAEELRDLADTAAVIAQLDLVIAVDTAVAHLAGAMGKPVWVLLPFSPDWRWLLEREDSPWYPTARLFRQPKTGDWRSVIERVRGELERCL